MDDIIIEHEEGKDYIAIPVTKAKASIEVCVDDLPPDVYKEVLIQGLKTLLNRGQADIKTTGLKDKELEKAQAIAMDVAKDNLEKVYSGKVRMSKGVKSKGLSGAVKTEAMRIARLIIKDGLKAAGKKISHIPAKDISAAAAAYLETEQGKEIVAQAQAAIKEREQKEGAAKEALEGIIVGVKEDAKLVAKAEQAAAKKKKPAKDGVVAQKAKPQAEHRAH